MNRRFLSLISLTLLVLVACSQVGSPPGASPSPTGPAPQEDYTYQRQWGTEGSGDGQFKTSFGVAVDGRGNVYVADTYNNRIQVFASSTVQTTDASTASGVRRVPR